METAAKITWPKVDVEVRARLVPRDLVVGSGSGYHQASREHLLLENKARSFWRARVLAFLRDNVNPEIPRMYYKAVLGHDLHISTYAELYVRHYHATERDPFTGLMGWMENVGLVSQGLTTVEFRDFQVDQLVAESSEYGDYKFHRPGTSNAAENNTDVGLTADAGLEATGAQAEGASADIYKSIATVTADTSETWQEHSIASQTGAGGGTMMDRNVLSPTVSVVNLDTVEFTYQITFNEEA